jgi:hypothetical protein
MSSNVGKARRRLLIAIAKLSGLFLILVLFSLPFIASFIGFFVRELETSDGKKLLPPSAANVTEHLTHGFVGGDFWRLLKADLPKEDYAVYAKSLNLHTLYQPERDQAVEGSINLKIGDAPEWWNPPNTDSTTYFEHIKGDDHLRVLRYHNGSIYYLVASW